MPRSLRHPRSDGDGHAGGTGAVVSVIKHIAAATGHRAGTDCSPAGERPGPVLRDDLGTALAAVPGVTTILLVDDDPGVRYALTEVLCDRGYRVIGVDSGVRALAELDGRDGRDRLDRIDVVVTDLSMPGMDGLELTSRIAARAPALPVILLTAHSSDQLVRVASSRGACSCLSKPFDIDDIARVIEGVLAARRGST